MAHGSLLWGFRSSILPQQKSFLCLISAKVNYQPSAQITTHTMADDHRSSHQSAKDRSKLSHGLLPGAAGGRTEHEEESPRKIQRLRWNVVVITIVSSTFLYALDNTIVVNIRPSIIHPLGQIEKLPWISVAYAVGEVGSNPFWYLFSPILTPVHVSDHIDVVGERHMASSILSGCIWHWYWYLRRDPPSAAYLLLPTL